MSETKKKLPVVTSAGAPPPPKELMPEVLPKPQRVSTATGGGPRSRTVAHMQRLLATATAVTVAGTASISCGKEARSSSSSGTEGRGCATKAKDAGDTTSTSSGSSGYAVVDPMPTPAYCPGLAPLIKTSAKMVAQPNGAINVIVTFSPAKGRDDFKYVKDAAAVAYAASVVSSGITPDGILVVTAKLDAGLADAGNASISISVKGTCNQGPATLSASVSWTGPLKASALPTPTVYLNEY